MSERRACRAIGFARSTCRRPAVEKPQDEVLEFLAYYHTDRTRLSLGKEPPIPRAVCVPSSPSATVVSLPRVDGLHHRYEWREAA